MSTFGSCWFLGICYRSAPVTLCDLTQFPIRRAGDLFYVFLSDILLYLYMIMDSLQQMPT
ncbi:uncharacterized protein ASCRUDRAFT_76433 [Ascoidea rubescens DSM 1968]|uniref:Uncharacterized protein n=1 Tax=Ascoidea rubescens DSM 1968 TaxID=1344418 RepID=A0A1D2VG10_9ASCO|nr:hypothetical protein ASCRUDRAFT_76433 [Ascoidea rubescens DSM 1968]ODV60453.1 hypothetical protein ASCRUDRAFT_76433 [Ascoidea rubescens DSM 1968]